ncbi:cysteine--tRNA ligase [Roseomonas stagni]|uniref:Cysteine--tRNA ligase n=1 Tax=Falsiroseomonas algicola TaxID=2716930 RepID=A0A6M1LPF2_9PROT|nr:cysteine--tRNA ligase [Falsiroseomonas algicola]NGM22261.1 cysteine--tRNA ligase [Falsiroseomonas algicola]
MDIQLHNSATRRKERFEPLDPAHIRLYVCGPTVYDLAHLGNARPVVVFDVLARLLRRVFPKVTYARNITDVDDKIIDRARDSGEPIDSVTSRTTADFHRDMAALGNLPPDIEPRATGTIPEMVALIERLVANGHAYAAEGHVLFAVASFAQYGALSGRSPEEMLAGARVEVAPYKRDPGDFVLWKPSTPEQPGWDSPWGRGRPGWHIECSAMSWKHLGPDFDIHGGGADLMFPHHENEVAQSVCAFPGSHFARYWMHNGMLLVDGEKMSKSLGNFRTVQDILALGPWAGEAFRLLLLRTHYRMAIDYTVAGLEEARRELDRFYRALAKMEDVEAVEDAAPLPWEAPSFEAALADDLNTPLALATLHHLVSAANDALGRDATADLPALKGRILACGRLLGLLGQAPAAWFRGEGGDEGAIEAAIAARLAARKAKDWGEADRIRKELAAQGILLEDGPAGTSWRRA